MMSSAVTHDTKKILGVDCVVVRDTASVGGQIIEDTFDFFAEDKFGNVWYMGGRYQTVQERRSNWNRRLMAGE